MEINTDNIDALAIGAAILGCGGGGATGPWVTMLRLCLNSGFKLQLVTAEDIPAGALVAPVAFVGAPTVCDEKLPSGDEANTALKALERLMGKKAFAVIPAEVGGSNLFVPLILGAQIGIPVVDGDGMGRAFPEAHMVTFSVNGISASPTVIVDEFGTVVTIEADSDQEVERLMRPVVAGMGASAASCDYPLTGRDLRHAIVKGTISAALEIGTAVLVGRKLAEGPFKELKRYFRRSSIYGEFREIYDGKITDLVCNTENGFAVGKLTISPLLGDDTKEPLEVIFRNENLVARIGGKAVAMVPDLICILDRETAEPIPTEHLTFGQRVRVVGIGAPEELLTPKGLEVWGPKAFGFPEEFASIANTRG